ncbi:hypothetical protein CN384_25685 [Bacillus thuringiensis]|uniref:hypothetical protein n=1 Tax=Bacillus thuringiensis TaxID=1428 RepID=UPI000BF73347|nr:hypothetical protein [Bacillus thuringiensis]PFA22323.1 hypothetical protein CN384_25685 [Bacillus thuringiensis]PGN16847.1 hypothetical protein CN951_25005 [Bacillus thuringiensis]
MSEEVNGNGVFKFGDTNSLEGRFNIELDVQNPWDRSKNIIIGEFDGIPPTEIINNDDLFYPWNFIGATSEGKEITGTNLALKGTRTHYTEGEYNCNFEVSQLTIGELQECEEFEFWIPNFIIGFDQSSELPSGQRIRNKTYLNLEFRHENFSVELTDASDSGHYSQETLNRKDDFISVKMIIKKESGPLTSDLATEVIDTLLDLYSIAYGWEVRWTNLLGYNNNQEVFHLIRKLPPGKLNPFRQLIHVKYPNHLTNFIQTSFPFYSDFDSDTKLSIRKLAESIHLAGSTLTFPIPFIIIGSAIEEFVKNELDDIDVNYIQRLDRRRIYQDFKTFMQHHVHDLLSEEDQSDLFNDGTLHQKWTAMLQRNLRIRITRLLEKFEIDFNAEHINRFVQKRNNAAHGSYEYSSSDYIIWSQMVALLEKVLLKKLRYEGDYWDFSTSPAEFKNITTR